jgi:hypothetical protein
MAATSMAVLLPAAAAFGAADDHDEPTADEAITSAVRWIGRQQREDGGFDGFVPGAATPDGILALAESAQTEATWANRSALQRVEQDESEAGHTPLDAARRLARGNEDPVVSGRLILRVALPLGVDAGDEGPFGDVIDRATQGLADEETPFADRVDLALALTSAAVELPEGTLDGIVAAQQPTGGWAVDGDPEAETADPATTGAVVDLLVLAGTDVESGPIVAAMQHLASTQARNGTWADADGDPSALATSGAVRAIRAVGHDPSGSCWQTDLSLPAKDTSAEAALIGLQDDDGRFAGEDPVVATASAVHALSGRWLPRGLASEACVPDDGRLLPFEPSLLVLGAIALVGVGGGVRILRSAPSAY